MLQEAIDLDLQSFEDRMQGEHLRPLWRLRPPIPYIEPNPEQRGHLWQWSQLRSHMLEAARLVPLGAAGADRRVLILQNPELQGPPATTRTLLAAIQLVHAHERAPLHRHTPAAIRFIIEGQGALTFVGREPCSMAPGDLILTPNWAWHGHLNETDRPTLWMDGLDLPLMTSLNTWFQEELPDPAGEPQALKPVDDSLSLFGQGTLLPTWQYEHHAYSPLMRYKGEEAIGRLLTLADQPGSPFDGVALAYANPTTGGPVLPTIACWIQVLRPGERTQAHRHTSSAVYHILAGRGHSVLNGERFDWGEHDIFILPNWTWHEHANASDTEPAILFSFGDTPVLRALDLYREQAYTDNGGHQPILTTFGQRSGEPTPG